MRPAPRRSAAAQSHGGRLGTLAARPWGVGRRPQTAMRPIASDAGLPNPLATHPAGQAPSLIALVEMSACGPVRAASSVNFGTSGLVLAGDSQSQGAGGAPVFAAHTLDQLPIWRALGTKPTPRLFSRTLECLARRRREQRRREGQQQAGSEHPSTEPAH
jgi:hypothetical protein